MTRHDVLLAALASGYRAEFSPVQLQKLMFLIDRNVADRIGGPFFNFRPYDYGPFDAGVYEEFAQLEGEDLGEAEGQGRDRRYRLNDEGRARARGILAELPADLREYFSSVAQFVQRLSFTSLVSSIYKQYPDMKVNSVFRG